MTEPPAVIAEPDPSAAWRRAVVYFAACWVLAIATGVTGAVFTDRLATAAQLESAEWWALFGGSLLVVIVAYGFIWPRGTETHERPLQLGWAVGFGLLWGASEGQLFAAIWEIASDLIGPTWVVGLVAFLVISAFTGIWHDRYWDIHVAPRHNIEAWNARKVFFCHIPNLVITLTFLGRHGNVALFVGLQTLALTISTVVMHFPAPTRARAATA